ncbi:MAG: hypothetical protein A2Y04_05055 [Omnitrophica WOR_2 bacterium GWC2_45_7]|nr:MAG: hypothetical protein A2Y04_05055 [Omnitrophica WOR_2 bacterium GWC2_45_7]
MLKIKDEIIDLIRDAGFGFLATTDDNQPRVRPMMPYLTEDGQLLIALLPRSRTIQQIKKNPLIEMCFVDRKMWYCRITGKASLSNDKEKKEVIWNNIPMLRQYFGGPQDTNFYLLIVEIQNIETMTPHQKIPDLIKI